MSSATAILNEGTKAAREEEARLRRTAHELEAEMRALDVEQRQIEREAGDALLDARFSGDTEAEKKVAQRLEEIRLKRTLLERQRDACLPRIAAAEIARWYAEARACREAAVTLRKEAAEHWKYVEDLLAKINKHERCTYLLSYPRVTPERPVLRGISDSLRSQADGLDERAKNAIRRARMLEGRLTRKQEEANRAAGIVPAEKKESAVAEKSVSGDGLDDVFPDAEE